MIHTAENWLKLILRFNGVLYTLSIVGVLMPQSWLVWCVSKVEPGLYVGLFVSFLARSLWLYFFLVGLLFIAFAEDVKHYKVPIRIFAVWCLMAIVSMGIYAFLNLPHIMKQWFFWAIVIDGMYALVTALAILVFQSRMKNDQSSKYNTNE